MHESLELKGKDDDVMTPQEQNIRWLIDMIDRIHVALCPSKSGTWQERARQAVAKERE